MSLPSLIGDKTLQQNMGVASEWPQQHSGTQQQHHSQQQQGNSEFGSYNF
jgi:hypothetical protein